MGFLYPLCSHFIQALCGKSGYQCMRYVVLIVRGISNEACSDSLFEALRRVHELESLHFVDILGYIRYIFFRRGEITIQIFPGG